MEQLKSAFTSVTGPNNVLMFLKELQKYAMLAPFHGNAKGSVVGPTKLQVNNVHTHARA